MTRTTGTRVNLRRLDRLARQGKVDSPRPGPLPMLSMCSSMRCRCACAGGRDDPPAHDAWSEVCLSLRESFRGSFSRSRPGSFCLACSAPLGWDGSGPVVPRRLGKQRSGFRVQAPRGYPGFGVQATGNRRQGTGDRGQETRGTARLTTHHSPLTTHSAPATPQSAIRIPQLAPVGPLVADQIDLDPSITLSPALPRPTIATSADSLPAVPSDPAFTAQQDQASAGDSPSPPPATVIPEPAPNPSCRRQKPGPIRLA